MNTAEAQISKLLTVDMVNFLNASDAEGYASLHAEQVLWFPPNHSDQTTRDGVKKGIGELFQESEMLLKATIDDIKMLDDVAWVSSIFDGTLKNKASGEEQEVTFRALGVFEKIEGQWKVTRNIWNSKPA